MAVTESQPVSTGNLKDLMGGGYLGGAVLYDAPDKVPNNSSSNQDTVTLAIPAENFRTLDVWLLFYKDADTGCAAHVSFPTNIMSYTPREASDAYIGFVPGASAGDATSISVYELSGTTLTIAARKVSIVRVVGER